MLEILGRSNDTALTALEPLSVLEPPPIFKVILVTTARLA